MWMLTLTENRGLFWRISITAEKILAWLNCLKAFWQRERSSVKKVYIERSGISADSVSEIILKAYTYFPALFTRNYTLAKVFAIVRHNATLLSFVAKTSGIDENVIEQTFNVYLLVVKHLQPLILEIRLGGVTFVQRLDFKVSFRGFRVNGKFRWMDFDRKNVVLFDGKCWNRLTVAFHAKKPPYG